jgi:hypothetical protein
MANSVNVIANIATVANLQGDAIVHKADGTELKLRAGMVLAQGDVVITAPGAHANIQLAEGGSVDCGNEKGDALTLDKTLLDFFADAQDVKLADADDAKDAFKTIVTETDFNNLEATAAGGDAGDTLSGNTFVALKYINTVTTPSPWNTPAPAANTAPTQPTLIGVVPVPVTEQIRLSAKVTLDDVNVDEDGEITFTASVDVPSPTSFSITLSNGVVINFEAGSTTGSSAPQPPQGSDVFVDASSTEITIDSATGGDFASIDTTSKATLNINDSIDTVTVDLSATSTVDEGVEDGITYTATLSGGVAKNDITVTLANGEKITIAAGQTSGTVSIDSPSEDIYIDAGSVTNSIASALEGGTTEKLEAFGLAADTSVSTSVTDTIPSPGVTVDLSATSTVDEGVEDGITYTATLSGGVAKNDITVTLANGEKITIAAGQTSGTVSIDSPSEDIYIDAGSVTNSIASALEGGTTEKLEAFGLAADTSVSTSVTDTIPSPGVTVDLSATSTVDEGVEDGITYTATLSGGVAKNDITVTLANGEKITIAAGQTSGTVSIDSPSEDIYIDAGSVTNSIASALEGGTTEKLEAFGLAADTSVSTSVTDTIPSPGVTVDLSATSTVDEGVEDGITYTATLSGGVAKNDITVTLANGEKITIAAGQTSGTVSIDSPSEDIYIDAGSVTNSIASALEGGTTEKLEAFGLAADTSVSTSVTDTIPSPGVTVDLSATSTVDEGVEDGITYTATLSGGVAKNDITVTLANGEKITIAAGQTSGTVSIDSPSEDIYIDAGSVTNSIASALEGGTTEKLEAFGLAADTSVSTSVTDTIPSPGVTVDLSATSTVDEGVEDGITYTATLSGGVAKNDITVTLANGEKITIAAGQTSGTVSIDSPSEDIYIDAGSVTNSIASALEGGTTEKLEAFGLAADTSVSTSVTDTIPSPGVTVDLSATSTVDEGVEDGITYTATLSGGVAKNDITVTLANGEKITIAAGQTSGTVSIDSPSEDIYIDAGSVTNSIASALEGGTTEKLEAFGLAADTSVSTSVTDTIPSPGVTVDLSATSTVDEGVEDGITYTATLSGGVAKNDITVTLANGEKITIAAGQTSGTVSIDSPSEDIYIDAGSVTNSIASALEGGTTEKLEAFGLAADTSVSTSVTDTIPSPGVTVDLSATSTVDEGVEDGITYTATLSGGVAKNDITVTLANGEKITIAAGQTSGTVSIDSPSEDIYIDAGSVTNSIASALEGGTTEKLEAFGLAADTSVSTSVTDTIPSPGVTVDLSATSTVDEGVEDGITYTATLSGGVAKNDITVTLANGEKITIAAGQTSGTVSIDSPSEDIYIDAGSVTNSIASALEGGTTEKLEAFGLAADTSVSTSVTDTIPSPGVTVDLSATSTVDEGVEDGITYTATLSGGVAKNDITVTLANGEKITIAAGQTSGTVSIDSPSEDIYIDAGSVTNSIASALEGGTTEKLEAFGLAADTSVSTSVTDTIPSPGVTVDLSATSTVDEGVEDGITYTATLSGGVAKNDITVTLANGEKITIAAGQTSGTVSIDSPSEDIYIDAGSVTNSIASALEGGTTEKLEAFGLAADTSVSTSVTDTIPSPGVTVDLSATSTVDEGVEDGITYTATLSGGVAKNDITVTLANGEKITIAAGQTSGTVSIDSPSEDIYIDAGSVTNSIASALEGGTTEKLEAFGLAADTSVSTSVTDTIPSPGVTVDLSATSTVDEGVEDGITYTATLSGGVAKNDITVTLANGEKITIAAGQTSGTVSIDSPSEDIYIDAGSVTNSIASALEGGTTEKLEAFGLAADTSVSTSVTDTIDNVLVSISGPGTVNEGEKTADYTVSLANAATSDVTVTLTYTGTALDGKDYTKQATLTIKSGDTSAKFTLNTTDDVYADNGETIVMTITGFSGGGLESIGIDTTKDKVTTTIVDETANDVPGKPDTYEDNDLVTLKVVSVDKDGNIINGGKANAVLEGETAYYKVVAFDSIGNQLATQPTAGTVTINFTNKTASSDDYSSTATTVKIGDVFNALANTDINTENSETFNVKISPDSYALGPTFEAVAYDTDGVTTTIGDVITVSDVTVYEEPGTNYASFTVTTASGIANQTITLSLQNGTATSADYSSGMSYSTDGGNAWLNVSGATIKAPVGGGSILVRVLVTDDVLADSGEKFTLTAAVTSGSAIGTATIFDSTENDDFGAGNLNDNQVAFTLKLVAVGVQTIYEAPSSGQSATATYKVIAVDKDGNDVTNFVVNNGGGTAIVSMAKFGDSATWNSDYDAPMNKTVTIGQEFTASANNDAVEEDNESFTVSLIDGSFEGANGYEAINYATNTVTTTIVSDDAYAVPEAYDYTRSILEGSGAKSQDITTPVNSNIMLIMDVSGSMGTKDSGTSASRIELAKAGAKALLDKYDVYGDVMVQVVKFDSNASVANGGTWMTISAAKTYIDSLRAGSYTNYDRALDTAMTVNFGGSGAQSGALNVSYFFSDGNPTEDSAGKRNTSFTTDPTSPAFQSQDIGVQTGEEWAWKQYLEANDVISYAYKIGAANVNLAYMNPIAYDGATASNINAGIVADLASLASTVTMPSITTTVTIPAGNFTGNIITDSGSIFGPDGAPSAAPNLLSIKYGTQPKKTFTSDADSVTVTLDGNLGTVLIKGDGSYTYTPGSGAAIGSVSKDGKIADIEFTIQDSKLGATNNPGDTSTATFTIKITDTDVPSAVNDTKSATVSSGAASTSYVFDTAPTFLDGDKFVANSGSSKTTSIAVAAASDSASWISASSNSQTLDASVASGVLTVVDGDGNAASNNDTGGVLTPEFTLTSASKLSFDAYVSGKGASDTVSWTVYQKGVGGAYTAMTGNFTGSITSTVSTKVETATTLSSGTYRLVFVVNDATGAGTVDLSLKVDNIQVGGNSVSLASGNVTTNDTLGTEGATVTAVVSGLNSLVTSTSTTYTTAQGYKQIAGDKGTLYIKADGSYVYVANANASDGDDAFTYTLAQADGDSSTATLTISVTGPDITAPTTTVSTVTFSADTGTSDTDFVTNTAAQTISGTLSAVTVTGEVVKVSLDNGTTWNTATNTIGQNSFSYSGTLISSNTLQVRVEDEFGNAGTAKTQAYVLDVTAPSITSPTTATAIDENVAADTTVYTAVSTDARTVTYSLKAGNDAASFTINSSTGVVKINGIPDYEAKSSYSFTVVATDAAGNASEQAVTLAINNLGENSVDDILVGTAGDDTLSGLSGNDTINGAAGNDTITGGDGNDTITGGAGNDAITGGAGNDTIIVNAVVGTSSDSSRAQVSGNSNDTGADTITGFDLSNDTLKIVATNVTSFVHATDTAIGTAGGTNNGNVASFLATTGLIELNQTTDGDWDDSGDIALTFTSPTGTWNEANFEARIQYDLTGTANADTITTGALNDTISGGDGNDTISGGAGDDRIMGGAGNDIIDLGTGSDTIVFEASSNGADTVTTFASGTTVNAYDVLDFSAITNITAGLESGGGGFDAVISAFSSSSNASAALAGKLALYDAGNGNIGNVNTAAEVAGLFSGNDIGLAASSETVLLTGATGSTTVYAWHVVNNSTQAVASSEVTLLATITLGTGLDITKFNAANIIV